MRDTHPRIAARRAARAVALATIAVIWCATTAPRADAIGLVSGLGGPRDYGENVLAANDDDSTAAIDITSVFGPAGLNFFGTSYTALYLNNNGNLTFSGPLSTYTPFGISGGSTPIIAAFFADVDTRGTPSQTDSNLVYYDLDTVNGVFTATWDLVGYYEQHSDKLNNFQIRLISQGGGNFDIEFRYQSLQWTTGDASDGSGGLGGQVARAGYSAGDQINFAELSAAGDQAAMLDLVNQSNVGTPGRFLFAVSSGHPQICGDGAIDGFEECDDQNVASGDGCNGDCQIEPCYTCTGEPSDCTPLPDDTSCSDGQFCNGEESCHAGACDAGTPPCALACDEGSDGCVVECPASPLTCRAAAKSVLVVKDKTDDTKDKLIWKWIKGAATSQSEFGDPTDATSYALCVYGGPGAALIDGAVVAPSASAWQASGSTGYKFKSASPGVQKIVLRSSATDKSKVLVKGRGLDLPDLSPPVATPLVVQLVNARNGLCWGSTYQDADLLKNDSGLLKGKTP